ncbi:MAG: response regulator, partial [Fibrobacteria bacterium]
EQQSYARASRESGEHLLALINQVLDFSKIGSGHLELDVSEFALESIVESAYTSVLETAQKKGMEIVSRPDPDLPGRVLGDPVRLQQVLMNLIGNAVKFSDRGEVCINSKLLSRGSGQCEILFEITDQGPGLSVASRERLFQPFRQGDASLSRKVGGTGLGLAISKELVERMGGRIWAENRIPRGSSFRFTVRLGESSGFPLPAYADGAERKRVVAWMLESQRGYLAPLTASLHRFGFETQAWTDGEEMRRKLSAGAAPGTRTLAVLSILPDGAGLEGDLRILASAAESGIPVLCTLPFIAQSQGARLLAAGAAGILTKPFRNADIQAAIRKALPDWEGGDAADRDKEKSGPSGLGEWMEPPLVLVVDDHPVNLTVASAMLKRMGCTVETVLDGSSALLATSERPYDLVFMDCQMPVMDGYETTRKFRARESEGQHTPIIALTAHATAGVKEHCLAEGMDDYVSKPFTYGEIGLMVRKWVKPGLDWNPPSNPGEDPQTLSVGVEPQEGLSDWDRSPATGFEDSEATVDWVRLDNLSDGSAEASVMVEKLIRLFIDTTRLSLDSVEQDLREQRMEAFIKGLHRMKGGCGTIGARAMFNHLKAMESESESGDGESLRIMLVRLEAIFAETCGLLERLT